MEGVLDLFWNYSVRMSSYIALEINKVHQMYLVYVHS